MAEEGTSAHNEFIFPSNRLTTVGHLAQQQAIVGGSGEHGCTLARVYLSGTASPIRSVSDFDGSGSSRGLTKMPALSGGCARRKGPRVAQVQ